MVESTQEISAPVPPTMQAGGQKQKYMFVAVAVTASTATGILAAMRPPAYALPCLAWLFLRVPHSGQFSFVRRHPRLLSRFPTDPQPGCVVRASGILPLAGTFASELVPTLARGPCSAFLRVGEDSIMDFYIICKKNFVDLHNFVSINMEKNKEDNKKAPR